ncbi:hypothetical protein BJ912DRAFT_1063918 [Pholiota molesta]|nr:hypothetical protein BJ912DRAFT_1063918 [Pholiota molesta]
MTVESVPPIHRPAVPCPCLIAIESENTSSSKEQIITEFAKRGSEVTVTEVASSETRPRAGRHPARCDRPPLNIWRCPPYPVFIPKNLWQDQARETDMGIKDDKFKILIQPYPLSKKKETQEHIRNLKKRIQATHDMLQLEEPKCRKRVLRRLAFTTAADIVDMKGGVACEISSSGNELLLTELVFTKMTAERASDEVEGRARGAATYEVEDRVVYFDAV